MSETQSEPTARERVEAAFTKWSARLGLAWWAIDLVWVEEPMDVLRAFRTLDPARLVAATVEADWQYGIATISINLPLFGEMTDREIEEIVLHELCHVLVNEMREGEMHHEERVVTGLTKAFLWTESMTKDGDA